MSGEIMSNIDANIEVLLTRMEGKIDLVNQSLDSTKRDIEIVRDRMHEVSNEVQMLKGLNIPVMLATHTQEIKDVESAVKILEQDRDRRTGALGMAKFMYGGAGVIGTIGIAVVAKLIGVFQ